MRGKKLWAGTPWGRGGGYRVPTMTKDATVRTNDRDYAEDSKLALCDLQVGGADLMPTKKRQRNLDTAITTVDEITIEKIPIGF